MSATDAPPHWILDAASVLQHELGLDFYGTPNRETVRDTIAGALVAAYQRGVRRGSDLRADIAGANISCVWAATSGDADAEEQATEWSRKEIELEAELQKERGE